MRKRIAVIGGGAKAAALAAKAQSLNATGLAQIELTIFERGTLGSAWTGSGGYTNGTQQLCTPAERDVGFPYDRTFGPVVLAALHGNFSWSAFSTASGRISYSDWVGRGTRRPTHAQFAEYIEWVMRRSGARIHENTEVTALTARLGKWGVATTAPGGGRAQKFRGFDAVVATGPGPARNAFALHSHPLLFNGTDVWQRLRQLETAIRAGEPDAPIVIVGGGGAAAAIAAWLIDAGHTDRPIIFIARQATFYARTGRYFENLVFDNEDLWSKLGQAEKTEFVDRITRGVVWEFVSDRLMAASRTIAIEPGRATGLAPYPAIPATPGRPGVPGGLRVTFAPSDDPKLRVLVDACAVIDASGFDPWWFKHLLSSTWRKKTPTALAKLAEGIDFHLRFPVGKLPPLHVPGVAQAQGPGFNSLMVLGRMADRILMPYILPSHFAGTSTASLLS